MARRIACLAVHRLTGAGRSCSSRVMGCSVKGRGSSGLQFSMTRMFSVTPEDSNLCWKCGQKVKPSALFCDMQDCGVVQHLTSTEAEPYSLFGVSPPTYEIDLASVENAYKNLQKRLHPDKFAAQPEDIRDVSNSTSTLVNMAYQKMRDPIARAQHLAQLLFQVNVFEEGAQNKDQMLMLEMFEWHERIAECGKDKTSLTALYREVQQEYQQSVQSFTNATNAREQKATIQAAIKMKFYHKMLEELEEILESS